MVPSAASSASSHSRILKTRVDFAGSTSKKCPLPSNENASPAAHSRRLLRRLVHAMLDGVFERRNNFLDVRRQLAMTLDVRPERDWRRKDQGTVQTNRDEIVVKVWPSTAMQRVARPSYTRSTILPM